MQVLAGWPCGFHWEEGAASAMLFEIRAFFGSFFSKKKGTIIAFKPYKKDIKNGAGILPRSNI